MATAQELLDATEQAIIDCLAAQSYSVRGRSKQAARLEELMQLRNSLKNETNESSQSAHVGRYVPIVD